MAAETRFAEEKSTKMKKKYERTSRCGGVRLEKLGKLGKMNNETIFKNKPGPKTKTKWRPKPNSPRKKTTKKEKKMNERSVAMGIDSRNSVNSVK